MTESDDSPSPSGNEATTPTRTYGDAGHAMTEGQDAAGGAGGGWADKPPYAPASQRPGFVARRRASCHCGRVKYSLGRERPLASKFCHCRGCQVLHGKSLAPQSAPSHHLVPPPISSRLPLASSPPRQPPLPSPILAGEGRGHNRGGGLDPPGGPRRQSLHRPSRPRAHRCPSPGLARRAVPVGRHLPQVRRGLRPRRRGPLLLPLVHVFGGASSPL